MEFKTVVSGSALQPETAPQMMQAVIKEMNNKTVKDLLDGIRSNWLTVAWTVKGGWSGWFYSTIKAIVKIVGKFVDMSKLLGAKSDLPGFEKRMVEYFQSQGYDTPQAAEMAKHIARDLTPAA